VTLHVLSAGAAKGLVQALEPAFADQHRSKLECSFGAVGAMRDKLVAGAPCDVIILTAAMINALAADRRAAGDAVVDLGRVFTGIAVPASQSRPDVGTAAALSAALSDAAGIHLPDPERATAGIHFASVLRKLGIYETVRERLRPYPSGAVAMRAMGDASAAGERNLIGCTQVTEILYTDGVKLVGLLPKEFELATMYSAAVCATAADPGVARAFVELLGGPSTMELRQSGGFVV